MPNDRSNARSAPSAHATWGRRSRRADKDEANLYKLLAGLPVAEKCKALRNLHRCKPALDSISTCAYSSDYGSCSTEMGWILHIVTFVFLAFGAWLTTIVFTDLWANQATIFGTSGVFITIFGVVFSIIESIRARSASELAAAAAKSAEARVLKILDFESITRCSVELQASIEELDKSLWLSTGTLARISTLYITALRVKIDDPKEPERTNLAALQSHAINATGPLREGSMRRLKANLMDMQQKVALAANKALTEKAP
jgi:hypothetical protein